MESSFLSVKEYAELCKISTAAVYNRINRGRLSFVELHGIKLVDVNSYRPGKAGRPKKEKQ